MAQREMGGGKKGAAPILFLGQNEAGRAEENYFWGHPLLQRSSVSLTLKPEPAVALDSSRFK